MIPILPALVLTLAAGAASACAVAEGCPMGRAPQADPCAAVRTQPSHVCVRNPSGPEGHRIETDPSPPDCGAEGCGPAPPAPERGFWRRLLGI